MEVSVLRCPTEDLHGDPCQIKTARRKVASTKQFIKGKVHSPGGRAGRFQEVESALGCFGNG